MAKKIPTIFDAQTTEVLSRLQEGMTLLKHDAERLLRRTEENGAELFSAAHFETVDQIFEQGRRFFAEIEDRTYRGSKQVESRAERWLLSFEEATLERFRPILRYLDIVSRDEIRRLDLRITQVETQLRPRKALRRGRIRRKEK